MKKWAAVFYAMVISLFLGSTTVFGAESFSDVPAGGWAEAYIQKAADAGIISGYGNGKFGYGDSVTRAQFASMLARLFEWSLIVEGTPSFTDNADRAAWYYGGVEAAVSNGAVLTDSALFRPNDAITREEMAVMLVRALGYQSLSEQLAGITLPFTDVTTNKEFIAMAYDFHIISGTSPTTFSPNQAATREQAATMMIRLYERFYSSNDFVHGFYAVSAYSQKDVIPLLDAVSFGWSKMEYEPGIGPVLNTTRSSRNEYGIPEGYEEVVNLAKAGHTKTHLSIYMDALSGQCAEIIRNGEARLQAIEKIVAELMREPLYTGVTIDFEQLRGEEMKDGFTAFLTALKAELVQRGLSLYVCVHPATSDKQYYDGYNYRAIGDLADIVILMAHDYAAKSLTEAERNAGFIWTPVTPIKEIYYALRAITDSDTGVINSEKILLAVSFSSVQWETAAGVVANANANQPTPAEIYKRMILPGTAISYAARYENPYMTYTDDSGSSHMIWYEDERSVRAKESLARMFGVTGLSMWRLGIIPSYESANENPLYYDVLAEIWQ